MEEGKTCIVCDEPVEEEHGSKYKNGHVHDKDACIEKLGVKPFAEVFN